jgi:hypothetical protein
VPFIVLCGLFDKDEDGYGHPKELQDVICGILAIERAVLGNLNPPGSPPQRIPS